MEEGEEENGAEVDRECDKRGKGGGEEEEESTVGEGGGGTGGGLFSAFSVGITFVYLCVYTYVRICVCYEAYVCAWNEEDVCHVCVCFKKLCSLQSVFSRARDIKKTFYQEDIFHVRSSAGRT